MSASVSLGYDLPHQQIRSLLEQAAREAGLVGRRRVLDSTALYDAVATMDTVSVFIEVPKSWKSLDDVTICTKTSQGWNGCSILEFEIVQERRDLVEEGRRPGEVGEVGEHGREIRDAAAFADTDHRGRDPRRPRVDRRERAGNRETAVVVQVDLDRNVRKLRADRLHAPGDVGRLGAAGACRAP